MDDLIKGTTLIQAIKMLQDILIEKPQCKDFVMGIDTCGNGEYLTYSIDRDDKIIFLGL